MLLAQRQQVAVPQPSSPAVFRDQTRPNSVPCGSTQFTAFGGAPQSIPVPHSGWLARLFLYVTGTLTTGAGTPSGSWATYPPFPWNAFRLIRVVTNTQTEICRMSGWGLYLFNRYYRRANFADADLDTNYNSTNRAGLLTFPSAGTPSASTAYTVQGWLEIPIVTDDALSLGMLMLQSDQVTLSVEITPPVSTDMAGTVAGVTVTPSLTYSVQAEFFEQPNDLSIRPNTQYVHMLREENRGILGVSQRNYTIPSGNTYLKIFGVHENSSAQIAYSNILSMGITYGQTVTPYNEAYPIHLAINKAYLGNTLPDGCFLFDFSRGSGIPGLYEGRDFLNSSLTTDLTYWTVYNSGLALSSPNLRLMTEQLQAIGAG